MEITFKEFLAQAKTKIDLLAMAVDSASHGLTVESHPRAQANIAMADKKLFKLRLWLVRLQTAQVTEMESKDIAVLREFLDREILGAQSYLSGADEKTSTGNWWGIALIVLLVCGAMYLWLY